MIKLYKGEFMLSPAPVEIDLNYCSHKCVYCFANLNNPKRKANLKQIINVLNSKENNPIAYFINNGYPVLFSNLVDPFASSNYKMSIPLIEIMEEKGISIAYQTKGGKGSEILNEVSKSSVYVTITSDNGQSEMHEPNAPKILDRIKFIETLIKNGHSVTVGVNPYIPEWFNDVKSFIKLMKSIGVYGLWFQPLHLNRDQVSAMNQKEKTSFDSHVKNGLSRKYFFEISSKIDAEIMAMCKDVGIHFFSNTKTTESKFFDNFKKVYKNSLPTYQDFFNHLLKTKKNNERVYFNEFEKLIISKLPNISHSSFQGYLFNDGFMIKKFKKIPKVISLKDVLKLYWQEENCFKFIGDNDMLSFLATETDIKYEKVLDDNNMSIYLFNNNGFENYYITEKEV